MRNSQFQARPRSGQMMSRSSAQNISYDYVATFPLTGQAGRLHEDVINVSVEGVFVAQEIGYGFAGQRTSATSLRSTTADQKLVDATLGALSPDLLVSGFRFNPGLERLAFPKGVVIDPNLTVQAANSLGLPQRVQPDSDLHFLLQIIDSGTGRELQNEPIHNIASLGKANGERPFRALAKPVAFLPRSTIRLQVEEVSFGAGGSLFIALHGYKMLGASEVTEAQLRAAQRAPALYGSAQATAMLLQQAQRGQMPSQRLVPFDYVATFDLTGNQGNTLEREVHINVDGGFVNTALGYGVAVADRNVAISFPAGSPDPAPLSDIKFSQFSSSAFQEGFRIRPELVSLAFQNGQLTSQPKETINTLFERLTLPDDVRFKFRVIDTGTGRELQNKPELNIAGLGIANGDRPFRELAYPMHFLPRSTIRVQVEEIFGRGRLFIAFQGYKILG